MIEKSHKLDLLKVFIVAYSKGNKQQYYMCGLLVYLVDLL